MSQNNLQQEQEQFQAIPNSLEISRRKMSSSVHQSKLLEESKKHQSKRFQMELPKSMDLTQTFKERLITNHQLKDIAPLDKQIEESFKTPKIPPSNPSKILKKGIILLGSVANQHLGFYLKTLESPDFAELQQSNELLIQNALCAGKFVNDYGLFCVLKEALSKKNIKTIVKQDCLLDEDGNYSGIPKNSKNLRRPIGLQELNYCCGQISLLKFKILQKFNISNYIFWTKDVEKLEQTIKQCLLQQIQILFIRLDENCLEFTLPDFDDNQSPQFISKLKQTGLDVVVQPLLTHFTFRMSDLNPWMNKEINKEWKLFALQNEQQQSSIGYHEFGSSILYNEIPSTKCVMVKLYGEIHQYQVVLQMSEKQVIGILLKDKS